MAIKSKTQTYNDGVLKIYDVIDVINENEERIEQIRQRGGILRYEERVVGMNRYWTGMQLNTRITRLLRIPRIEGVTTSDIAIPTDGLQYYVRQVQYITNVMPHSMDLSLERVDDDYAVAE